MTLLRKDPPKAESGKVAAVRYEDDAYSWALQQAAALRAGRLDEIDLAHLANEVADVAGREYDKLESALARVLQHLLKWDYQPVLRSRSWVLSVEEHRRRAVRQLRRHPGLTSVLDQVLADAYETARYETLRETALPRTQIPESLPYTWDDMMQRDVAWPIT